jgi:hypothetical protein
VRGRRSEAKRASGEGEDRRGELADKGDPGELVGPHRLGTSGVVRTP